jgi:hypothetical protein
MRVVLPLIAALLLLGAVGELIWLVLGAVAMYWLYRGGWRVLRWHRAQVAARVYRQAELRLPGAGLLGYN